MQINWEKWIVDGGEANQKPLRQAIHITLIAISNCESLKHQMMLKGGILMALCYDSTRFTSDIDLSQVEVFENGDEQPLIEELSNEVISSAQELPYGLDCRLQSSVLKPPAHKLPTFPVLEVKIGYAYNLDRKNHQKLMNNNCTNVLKIDFSFNEKTKSPEEFTIAQGQNLLRYSVTDLVAEKFRALLQQKERRRQRGQDLYDLEFLFRTVPEISELKSEILEALIESANSKKLTVDKSSMSDETIKNSTKADYDTLGATISGGHLEPFEVAYTKVESFYQSLPWEAWI